jgi:hypothetical protein
MGKIAVVTGAGRGAGKGIAKVTNFFFYKSFSTVVKDDS